MEEQCYVEISSHCMFYGTSANLELLARDQQKHPCRTKDELAGTLS